MNPTSTQRFRRATAALAVAWAALSLVLAIVPFFSTRDAVAPPFRLSGLGGGIMVEKAGAVAEAAGVASGDRILEVDGIEVFQWMVNRPSGIRPGLANTYRFETPDGRRYTATLLPEPSRFGGDTMAERSYYGALVLVGFVYLAIGVFVWRVRSERLEAWALLLFCSAMSAQLGVAVETPRLAWGYSRLFVNIALIPATIFHLFTTYPIEPAWIVRRPKLRAIMYAISCGLAVAMFAGSLFGFPLPPMLQFSLYWTALTAVFCLASSAYERRRLREGSVTDRADVMLLGALVSFLPVILVMIAQSILGTILPWYIALIWTFMFPVAVAYGIVRRQLFEIRVVARSSAAYGVATLAITGLFALLITSADAVVSRFNVNARSRWFQISFLFFAILAFNPLRNRMQALVDRIFDRDRARYRLAVREMSDAMVSMLSIKEICDRILLALTDTMGVEKGMVMLVDEDGGALRVFGARGDWDDEAMRSSLSLDHPIVTFLQSRRALSRLDFDDESDPEVRDACRDVFDTLEIGLLVPILFGLDLLGVIAVGHKLSGDRIGVDDRQLLRTLANQSAIALENAKAYDEIASLNANLEMRVEERTEELREAQAQLVQSEKMASLGQLVAGIAHEINNPIGFVHANLQLMEEYVHRLIASGGSGPEADRARQALEKLLGRSREGTARIKKIVEDLRTFSRVDQADLQEVDVHEGLDRTVSLIEPRLKDGIEVTKDYGALPRIRCYAGQLNQVFMNLLINACDALGRRGHIVLRTRPCELGVRIEVEDDGPGIAPEVQRRIFDPFFTTKPVGKGTGLGLSISHGIVERHGGRIFVESEPGHGTRFVIELPLDAPAPETDPA